MTCILHDQSSKKLPQMLAVLTGDIPILPQKTPLLHISKTIFTINYIISKSWCKSVKQFLVYHNIILLLTMHIILIKRYIKTNIETTEGMHNIHVNIVEWKSESIKAIKLLNSVSIR